MWHVDAVVSGQRCSGRLVRFPHVRLRRVHGGAGSARADRGRGSQSPADGVTRDDVGLPAGYLVGPALLVVAVVAVVAAMPAADGCGWLRTRWPVSRR